METKGIFEKIFNSSVSFALAKTLMLSSAGELNTSYIGDKPKYTQKNTAFK